MLTINDSQSVVFWQGEKETKGSCAEEIYDLWHGCCQNQNLGQTTDWQVKFGVEQATLKGESLCRSLPNA